LVEVEAVLPLGGRVLLVDLEAEVSVLCKMETQIGVQVVEEEDRPSDQMAPTWLLRVVVEEEEGRIKTSSLTRGAVEEEVFKGWI